MKFMNDEQQQHTHKERDIVNNEQIKCKENHLAHSFIRWVDYENI